MLFDFFGILTPLAPSPTIIIEGSRTRVELTHKLKMGSCLKCPKIELKGNV